MFSPYFPGIGLQIVIGKTVYSIFLVVKPPLYDILIWIEYSHLICKPYILGAIEFFIWSNQRGGFSRVSFERDL